VSDRESEGVEIGDKSGSGYDNIVDGVFGNVINGGSDMK
jgi:hypothetical protein